MQKIKKQTSLILQGSMTLMGDIDKALVDLKEEREQSLKRLIGGMKGLNLPKSSLGKITR